MTLRFRIAIIALVVIGIPLLSVVVLNARIQTRVADAQSQTERIRVESDAKERISRSRETSRTRLRAIASDAKVQRAIGNDTLLEKRIKRRLTMGERVSIQTTKTANVGESQPVLDAVAVNINDQNGLRRVRISLGSLTAREVRSPKKFPQTGSVRGIDTTGKTVVVQLPFSAASRSSTLSLPLIILGGFALLAAALMTELLVRTLSSLSRQAQRWADGIEEDAELPDGSDEIGVLARSLLKLHKASKRREERLRSAISTAADLQSARSQQDAIAAGARLIGEGSDAQAVNVEWKEHRGDWPSSVMVDDDWVEYQYGEVLAHVKWGQEQSHDVVMFAMSTLANALISLDLLQAAQDAASSDSLTGLATRRVFDESIHNEVSRSKRSGVSCSLLILDLDHFKHVNDEYGHQRGDSVLLEVSNRIRKCSRDSDIPSRWGGEEFAILLPDADEEGAAEYATRLLFAIRSEAVHRLHVTASIGVATLAESDDSSNLIRRADQALYTAKKNGRDQIVIAGPSL